jgi:hypothetical protein
MNLFLCAEVDCNRQLIVIIKTIQTKRLAALVCDFKAARIIEE